ncbi:hypothetical protein WN48_01347 [Eufriesea mexicana]|uniref:Uncharacterized protein n=1 Tax=Eufriesea mexicana TaxID=516756 RepID=A0A310SM98_9HYME|nr:hypothetical protein WN48_01347 [Eufriesea mexicana]
MSVDSGLAIGRLWFLSDDACLMSSGDDKVLELWLLQPQTQLYEIIFNPFGTTAAQIVKNKNKEKSKEIWEFFDTRQHT